MIEIEKIQEYYKDDMVLFSNHALERIRQRGIKIKDIEKSYFEARGESITISKLAEILNVSEEEISMALDSVRQVESINEEIHSDCNNNILKSYEKALKDFVIKLIKYKNYRNLKIEQYISSLKRKTK